MTSTRKLRRQQARHDAEVRTWATNTAKALTLTLCQDTDPAVAPYDVGVVLDPGEKPWVQIPARCSLDRTAPATPGSSDPPLPAITPWLVTNQRLVGRFASGGLRGWRWEWAIGCLVDLTVGREYVHLDIYKDQKTAKIDWTGPGIAPLALSPPSTTSTASKPSSTTPELPCFVISACDRPLGPGAPPTSPMPNTCTGVSNHTDRQVTPL